MAYSEEHEKQKTKNYVVLGLIAGFVAVVFVVTMVKIKLAGGV